VLDGCWNGCQRSAAPSGQPGPRRPGAGVGPIRPNRPIWSSMLGARFWPRGGRALRPDGAPCEVQRPGTGRSGRQPLSGWPRRSGQADRSGWPVQPHRPHRVGLWRASPSRLAARPGSHARPAPIRQRVEFTTWGSSKPANPSTAFGSDRCAGLAARARRSVGKKTGLRQARSDDSLFTSLVAWSIASARAPWW